ncbi:hypothetical protein SCUCBS95973_002643 [Sporothrix curviconia]|uniref:Uncharacterized protein n=1 Tax=Sporothrix curviconia TaxID=1260050 RepID=A0ABP0B9L2_9PEZI
MAEISADVPVPAVAEDVDFTLDIPGTDAVAEDFDFDLGEAKDGANPGQDDGDGPTSTLTKIEIAADVDEIGYEEDEGQHLPEQEVTLDTDHHAEENNAPAHDDDADDEIGYEEAEAVETTITTRDDGHGVAEDGGNGIDRAEHQEDNREQNDIDFGFDEGGDSHAGEGDHEEHRDEHGHGGYDQEDGSHANGDEDEDVENAAAKEEEGDAEENEDDDDDDDEENQPRHTEVDQDDSDGTGQDYDGDDDDDEGSPSEIGLGELRNMYPASTFDVVVTWGEQVCPLFKTPGVEDPDSFYLDDYEAMNLPLSTFLETIRSSISSWVHGSDEIYIRVEDLGLEFGETTTEALLSQVTFHNLLALHNTLAKNDDANATKGVHITLGTRPNCLLRLKDLVSGAGAGKGLSAFQSASSRMDDSSDESAEAEAESDDSSPDVEVEDMLEEDDDDADEGADEDVDEDIDEDDAVDVDMAGSLDDQSVAGQSFAEAAAEEAGGAELETPMADEDDDADTGAVNEADYVDYTNDDVDDDAANGVLLAGHNGVSELATPHADVGDDLDFAAAEDDLLSGLAGDEKALEQADDLDLLEDINDDGELVSHDQEGAAVEASNGLEPAEQDNDHHGENDDDFLDLNGDIDETVASAETLEASTKADGAEASLETSATATLDHDEIDYEEKPAAEAKEDAPLDIAVDEIDWDDELKNAAPSSPTASGKRTREADESGDALLDDLPDLKRHRAGNTPS